ncbi:hypothetical protein ACSNN9_28460 [Micromonospora sp. URMC 107]|uniref:hypothetical protein n=1 Tax=Micromonospora sp. URMC 107 TaxID=3423418 RepID=UPI003F1E17B8
MPSPAGRRAEPTMPGEVRRLPLGEVTLELAGGSVEEQGGQRAAGQLGQFRAGGVRVHAAAPR